MEVEEEEVVASAPSTSASASAGERRLNYDKWDKLVLEDVNLHLPAGAVVAVVGEYGAGKSTLVKLL